MKQSDLFLESEGDRFYERNKDKPRLPDPVIEAMQACQLQPKSVLELGCGNGWRLAEIEKIWNPRYLTGYDASADAINNRLLPHAFQQDILEALKYIGDARYDTIIFGFCLYLVDREDLMMIAAHTDRVLQDKGHIIIHDFYPYAEKDGAFKVPYKHKEGVWSYHYDHEHLWLGNPTYRFLHGTDELENRDCVTILQKDIAAGWPERAE